MNEVSKNYHPFYITSDRDGGFGQKSLHDKVSKNYHPPYITSDRDGGFGQKSLLDSC